MNRRLLAACAAALCALVPASASAQDTAVAPQTSLAPPPSRAWVVVGGTSTSFLSDCTDCDEETAPYRHTSSLLANAGAPINPRTDIGAEFLLVRAHSSATDRIRVAFVMGSVQFRPWSGSGFFVKAGLGMAFVKNWIISPDIEDTGIRSKALALEHGAGGNGAPPVTSARRFSVRSTSPPSAISTSREEPWKTSWATSGRSAPRSSSGNRAPGV